VSQVDQYLDALDDDVVAGVAPDIADESDAAGVALMPRVVQTSSRRQSPRVFEIKVFGMLWHFGCLPAASPLAEDALRCSIAVPETLVNSKLHLLQVQFLL
jgi:hypothetical protein